MKKTLSCREAQMSNSFLFTPDSLNVHSEDNFNCNTSSEFLYSATEDSPSNYTYNNSSYLFIPSKENDVIQPTSQFRPSISIDSHQISQFGIKSLSSVKKNSTSINTGFTSNSSDLNPNIILSPSTSLNSTFDSEVSFNSNETNISIKSEPKRKRKKLVDHFKIGSALGTPCCHHECLLHYSVSGILLFLFSFFRYTSTSCSNYQSF